jgi:hypothetical protein
MDNKTPSEKLADALGRKEIAAAVGVGLTAVSNAVVRQAFPASWFSACQHLAFQKNVPFPADLFQQRGAGIQHFSMHAAQRDFERAGDREQGAA